MKRYIVPLVLLAALAAVGTAGAIGISPVKGEFKSSGKAQMNLQSYPGDTDAVGQILVGRADAVLTQDTSGAFQRKAHPGKLAIAYLFPESDAFGIYYRPADKKLGTALR